MTHRHISHPEPLPACAAGHSTCHINLEHDDADE
jgi:hypothetical protein